ncbi:MAG: DUF3857 domain-containing protein [Saprospiraceae bacterium]
MSSPIFSKTAGLLPVLIAFFAFSNSLIAQDYAKAWQSLANNDRAAARGQLQKALANPATAADAMSTLFFLETFEGKTETFNSAYAAVRPQLEDPYPYYFLLWTADAVVGDYGLKSPEQLKFLKKLVEDPQAPAALKTNALVYLNGHFITQQEKKKGLEYGSVANNVTAWQIVGPFDNIVESGFDKNYPPIEHPEPDAVFISSYNADIRWQKAVAVSASGWVFAGNMITWNNAISYAQSFVTAPKDLNAIVTLANIGSFKVWVNDRLIMSDPEMRYAEEQVFQAPCRLKKGMNRILVQNGSLQRGAQGFRLQLCDEQGHLLPDLSSSLTYAPYPKEAAGKMPERIPLFAETFFKAKLAAKPDNLVNYLLLARYYSNVSDYSAFLETINKALEQAPNCSLLHYYKFAALHRLKNLTGADEESKTIVSLDPESVFALEVKFKQELENENLEEAEKVTERYIELYGENLSTRSNKIQVFNKREKYQDAIQLLEEGYAQNQGNWGFAQAIYQIESQVKNDQEAAFDVYESFLKRDFTGAAASTLAAAYIEKGKPEAGIKLYEKLYDLFPVNPDFPTQLFNYYFSKKENSKAAFWLKKLLDLAPNSGIYLSAAAKLAEQEGDPSRALELFKTALKHGPNDFEVRERIRELEKKPALKKNFPDPDLYALLKNVSLEGKKDKYNWFYLLLDKQVVLYPEQNSEMTLTQVVMVLDEDGVNTWKENTIAYDSDNQRLIIEKAEVIKPSGKKIAAERDYNELVFTNLEPGDGIILRYRIQSYSTNRLSREYDSAFGFDWFVPVDHARFCLLTPKNVQIQHVANNISLEPVVRQLPNDDLTLYTWEAKNMEALENEPLTPAVDDFRKMVNVSTMQDWSLISSWYGDISARQARNDYEVKKLVAEMFPKGETPGETAKARRIYEWILKNISYSSVPFRQSGLIPQRASKVIQTRLGDCKDLATLYAALAREAGLKANLVLVSSRQNAVSALALPSLEFDHCLVKVIADGTPWYLELTMSSLPFGSLPNEDFQALALEIPFGKDDNTVPKAFVLDPKNRVPDFNDTQVEITVGKKDLSFAIQYESGGALTSWMRSNYKTLPPQKRLEEFQKNIAKDFDNPVSVKNVSFGNLEQLNDTLQHRVSFVVKNDVVEIGDMSTFKIPFYDVFVRPGAFPEEEDRKYPIAFRDYESADSYHDEITVRLPEGKAFSIVPANVELSYDQMRYSLTFTKTSGIPRSTS